MSEQNNNNTKKYWTSQLIPMKSSNSIQSLNHNQQQQQSPAKYTSSTSNINLVQKQRDTRRQLLNDQHQEQLMQQQLFYGQQSSSRTGRSLSQLPTSSGITHSYSNNSVDNSHITSATKNIYYNISSPYQLVEHNTKSLDNYVENSSLNYSRNSSRNGSKFNLEGANAYHSYENYVSERCSKNNKATEYILKNADLDKFNRMRDEDLNIDNTKWLEEKPISVLQLDQPDRAVLKIAGNLLFDTIP